MILQDNASTAVSTTIPVSQALSFLNDFTIGLYGVTKSEEFSEYSVASFGKLNFDVTKSDTGDLPDTLLYMVNFKDEKGFAILAGDNRLCDNVYCFTEKGTIDVCDFVSAFEYISESQTKTEEICNKEEFHDMGQMFVPAMILSSMLSNLKYGVNRDNTTRSYPITNNDVLIKTKWKQGYPFNAYTPIKNGVHCPAGCVAIACAQIMQRCKKPSNPTFDGVSCSWSEMGTVCNYSDLSGERASASAKDQVGHFLYHIGQRSLCRIRYGSDGSNGYADGVVRTLEYYDYSNVKKYIGFGATNQSKVSQMLSNDLPVYLDASDSRRVSGHAWVIDGEWNIYFHCNWGWNGNWDGYYGKNSCFTISEPMFTDSIDPENTGSQHEGNCYDWNFRLVTYSL